MPLPFAPLIAVLGADNLRTDDAARSRAISGWSAWSIKERQAGRTLPLPEAVVSPGSPEEVAALMDWARAHRIALRPLGAGTGAIVVEPASARPFLAVDLSRLTSRHWDEESLLVTAGAGTNWGDLETELNRHHFTLGHFPQTINAITVGGAVASNSIGLFAGRYGRVADIVAGLQVVLPSGAIIVTSPAPGAEAHYPLSSLFIGTEGSFGIITGATLRMRPLPEVRAFGAFAFEMFDSAVDAARLITRSDARPAALTILDEETASRLAGVPNLLIFAVEGEELTQTGTYQLSYAVCQQVGGTPLPTEVGDSWYDQRFETNQFAGNAQEDTLTDVLAIGVLWSQLKQLESGLRSSLAPRTRGISVRVSHCNAQGASLEVRFAAQRDETVTPYEQLMEIFQAAYSLCQQNGATCAHHYGVGTLRAPFLAAERGGSSMETLKAIKAAMDPEGILNPGGFL